MIRIKMKIEVYDFRGEMKICRDIMLLLFLTVQQKNF